MELFKKGTLWDSARRATDHALASGAMLPISTAVTYIEDAGVEFPVRRVLALKERQAATAPDGRSPFLTPDAALHVAEVSPTHVCLLNKFPVFNNHLLVVTRGFEDQDAPLNLYDFGALWKCMAEYPALGFYNAGKLAGASQGHKHLQIVPLPLDPRGHDIPIEPLLNLQSMPGSIGSSAMLPFPHVLARLSPELLDAAADAADSTLEMYRHMLREIGLDPAGSPLGAYNLLVTRNWILLVPRSHERFDSISLNGLAFAGHFLVRSETELEKLEKNGPLSVLAHVASR